MDLRKEIINEVMENGSIEEKLFMQKFFGISNEAGEYLTSVVHELYAKNYTPAEVKGFFQFGIRIYGLDYPHQKQS